MSNLEPQFTFSPDGVLSIMSESVEAHPSRAVDSGMVTAQGINQSRKEASLELLMSYPGTTVAETEEVIRVDIEVEAALDGLIEGRFDREKGEKLAYFLGLVDRLLPQTTSMPMNFTPRDQVDRVLPIVSAGSIKRQRASVNHHFQRWLNQPGLTEEAARASVMAMALMYGEQAKALRNFVYMKTNNNEFGGGADFEVATSIETFGIDVIEAGASSFGTVNWRAANLKVPSSGYASWAVDVRTRERVYLDRSTMRLYEMGSNNVDDARQALSLMLGLGSLAHSAAQYEGREDIYAAAGMGPA